MIAASPDAYRLMHYGTLALADVEANGIRIDVNYLKRAQKKVDQEIVELENELKQDEIWKIWKRRFRDKTNLGSRVQLGVILFDILGIPPVKTTKTGRPSTDEDDLELIEHEFIKKYLRKEKLVKLSSTYIKGILREVDGELLRPSFNLNLARTYRSQCSDPNFQNIPVRNPEIAKWIRTAFIPRDGNWILELDYGQIEVRVAACVTGDTLVETTSGSKTITDIIDDLKIDKSIYVYGYCSEKKRISVGQVLEGGITRKNADVFKVTLDNGQTITATKDHQFMHRSGIYIRLDQLVVGDSLMPFNSGNYPDGKREYQTIGLNNGEFQLAHRLVAEDVLGECCQGKVVHHKDENGLNNDPCNLEVMTASEHNRLHGLGGWNKGFTKYTHPSIRKISESKLGGTPWNKGKKLPPLSDEHKRKLSIAFTGRKHSDKTRQRLSEVQKKRWAKQQLTTCAVCKKQFRTLTNTHLKKHNLTPEEYKQQYNHKVVKIEYVGKQDVYNITVKGLGNYAVTAGVIIKNCYHKDPTMLEYIKTNHDMHHDMARECFKLTKDQVTKKSRFVAKNSFVFAQFYGSTYINVCQEMWRAIDREKLTLPDGTPMKEHLANQGITELGRCTYQYPALPGTFEYHIKKVENRFWNRTFPVYARWRDSWWNKFLERGGFKTLTGFLIKGPCGRRDVINYPIQGSAFHCLLWSLITLNRYFKKHKFGTKIIGQIHDSIILDVPDEELQDVINIANRVMTVEIRKAWPWIITPLVIEAEGSQENWFLKKEIPIG